MREIGIEEVQTLALDILVYIDKICRDNNLKYSLFYGSLIGIERHKGFIPWDDDIDIVMLRSDYDTLLNLLKENKRYKLLDFSTRNQYRYPFAKVVDSRTRVKTKQYFDGEEKDLGVFVDIFPLDMIPNEEKRQKEHHDVTEQYRLNMMDSLKFCYARSFSLLKSCAKLVLRFPHHRALLRKGGYKHWRDLYEKNAKKYNDTNVNYCGYLEFTDKVWGVFPIEWFNYYENIDFKGHSIMVIRDRKNFLKLRYGDYMQLPPAEERKTHHPYTFYYDD